MSEWLQVLSKPRLLNFFGKDIHPLNKAHIHNFQFNPTGI